jgi:hypothetical protein
MAATFSAGFQFRRTVEVHLGRRCSPVDRRSPVRATVVSPRPQQVHHSSALRPDVVPQQNAPDEVPLATQTSETPASDAESKASQECMGCDDEFPPAQDGRCALD